VASVRRHKELPLYRTEPVPDCSKTDVSLAKAEIVGDVGSSSMKTYFSKGKKYCEATVGEERETTREKQPCRHQSQSGRKWKRCSRYQNRDFPSDHGEYRGETGCPPTRHGGPWWSRYPPCSPWRTPSRSRWICPEGSCCLWREAHAGAGLLEGLRACDRPTLKQSVPEGLCPVGMTDAGAVLEEQQPMGRTNVEEHCEGLSPMGGTPCWEEEQCDEEGVAETKCYKVTMTPILHLYLPAAQVEEVEESGVKVGLRRRRGWEEGAYTFVCISQYPTLFSTGNKLH